MLPTEEAPAAAFCIPRLRAANVAASIAMMGAGVHDAFDVVAIVAPGSSNASNVVTLDGVELCHSGAIDSVEDAVKVLA